MLYNFNDEVRRTLAAAREQAIRLKHDHLGPEHMLLGLLESEEGVATTVLTSQAGDLDQVSDSLRASLTPGTARLALSEIPFTPEGKQVLEFAISEAVEFDHDYVGPEHLLLGLLGVGTEAASVLGKAGVAMEGTRDDIGALLARSPEQ